MEDLAKSWAHLKQGYGAMLYQYCNYLAYKLKFHKKVSIFGSKFDYFEYKSLN